MHVCSFRTKHLLFLFIIHNRVLKQFFAEMSVISSSPVLVTGGTGFIASHVIQQLLIKGYKVRIFSFTKITCDIFSDSNLIHLG